MVNRCLFSWCASLTAIKAAPSLTTSAPDTSSRVGEYRTSIFRWRAIRSTGTGAFDTPLSIKSFSTLSIFSLRELEWWGPGDGLGMVGFLLRNCKVQPLGIAQSDAQVLALFALGISFNDFREGRRSTTSTSRLSANRYRTCRDRKSTRLNSSHLGISYAVFC